MYDGQLSSCRAATCWRGACDAFMYFENSRLEKCTHAVQIVANLPCPIKQTDWIWALGSAFVRSAKSTRSNNIPDPIPMPIKDGLRSTLMGTKNLYEDGPNPFFSGECFFNLMGTRMVEIRIAKSV